MSTEVVHSVVVQPASRLSTFQSTVNYHADVLWIGYPEDRVEENMTSMLFTFPSKKISFMNMRAFDVSCVLSGMSSSVSPNVWHTQSASSHHRKGSSDIWLYLLGAETQIYIVIYCEAL
jgi:hypothetical protein